MQVGYIFQCAFELESWTDIAVVLVPSITLKMQLLELKSSTVRKLNNHLICLLFQTNRCFHSLILSCGISKGQPTNNLFFISYSSILFQRFPPDIDFLLAKVGGSVLPEFGVDDGPLAGDPGEGLSGNRSQFAIRRIEAIHDGLDDGETA